MSRITDTPTSTSTPAIENDNPFKQSHHATDAAVDDDLLLACCTHARYVGLGVTLWGFADDSNWTLDEALAKQAAFLPSLSPHIDRYIPALEGNETFGFDGVQSLVESAAAHLHKSIQIYLHWTHERGRWGILGSEWQGLYYQYCSDGVNA